MKYEYIAWDFNGTVLDDVYAALASVNDILARRNRPPITINEYYSYIESPIIGFYRHLFDLNEIPFEALADEFQAGYLLHEDKCHLMSGVIEVINRFNTLGAQQFILSASKREQILKQLKKIGLLEFFGEENVLGRTDHYAVGKTDLAQEYFYSHCISPQKVLIIGDTLGDYEVAQALGTDCILLSKGHQSKNDLESTGAPVIDDLNEIFQIIRKSIV